MKYIVLLFALVFWSCSDGDDTNFMDVSKFVDYSGSQILNIGTLNDGSSFSVVAYELDSLFDITSSEELPVEIGETKHYHPSYTSQYYYVDLTKANLQSKFVWVRLRISYDAYKDSVSGLEYFVEQNLDMDSPTLNLCSHVTQKRVEQLVKDGFPYIPAQKTARSELERIWGGDSCSDNNLKKIVFSNQFNMGELNKFRNQFSDGTVDSAGIVEKVDRMLDSNFFYGSQKQLLKNFLGVKLCENVGSRTVVTNELSRHYQDSLLCDKDSDMYIRLFGELDYELGPCLISKKETYACANDSDCYVCWGGRGWRSTKEFSNMPQNAYELEILKSKQ